VRAGGATGPGAGRAYEEDTMFATMITLWMAAAGLAASLGVALYRHLRRRREARRPRRMSAEQLRALRHVEYWERIG